MDGDGQSKGRSDAGFDHIRVGIANNCDQPQIRLGFQHRQQVSLPILIPWCFTKNNHSAGYQKLEPIIKQATKLLKFVPFPLSLYLQRGLVHYGGPSHPFLAWALLWRLRVVGRPFRDAVVRPTCRGLEGLVEVLLQEHPGLHERLVGLARVLEGGEGLRRRLADRVIFVTNPSLSCRAMWL